MVITLHLELSQMQLTALSHTSFQAQPFYRE